MIFQYISVGIILTTILIILIIKLYTIFTKPVNSCIGCIKNCKIDLKTQSKKGGKNEKYSFKRRKVNIK